jgi:hypothetical protein
VHKDNKGIKNEPLYGSITWCTHITADPLLLLSLAGMHGALLLVTCSSAAIHVHRTWAAAILLLCSLSETSGKTCAFNMRMLNVSTTPR